MSEKVPELTNGEFNEFVKEGIVLIDFFADWCMPCLMMAPIFEEVSEKFKGKIKFGKVNVQDNEEIARKFNVSSIPNFTVLNNGEHLETFVGAMSAEELEAKLRALL